MSKFNFNIDIEENNEHLSKSSINTNSQFKSYKDSLFVDLGLPSKTLWCKYNLDVDPYSVHAKNDLYGGIYAWGETHEKESYSWQNYSQCVTTDDEYNKVTKYCDKRCEDWWYWDCMYGGSEKPDGLLELKDEDDVAIQKSNGFLRIPSIKNFIEMYENTISKIANYDYNGINISGRLFTSKINGNSLFFPYTGDYNDNKENYIGYYWLSTLDNSDPTIAMSLQFTNSYCGSTKACRCFGMHIRPIFNK